MLANGGATEPTRCDAAYAGVASTTAFATIVSSRPPRATRISYPASPRLPERRIALAHAPLCAASPRLAPMACINVFRPRRNEHKGGGPLRAVVDDDRDLICPRITLPYSRSHSSIVGKAARKLSFSGSPAYTPE